MLPVSILGFIPDNLKGKFYNKFFNQQNIHKNHIKKFNEANLKYAKPYKMYDLVIGDVISGNIALTGLYESKLKKK